MSRTMKLVLACVVLVGSAVVAPARQQAAPAQDAPKTAPSWLVTLDATPKWDDSKPVQEQAGFAEHRAMVERLAKEGTLQVGGPLFQDFESRKLSGALWIVKAESADAARKLVETDPFVHHEFVKIASVRAFLATAGAWLAAEKPAGAGAK